MSCVHKSQLSRVALWALLAIALTTSRAAAQFTSRPRSSVGLSGGVAQFDMAGTGTAPFGAVRADRELTSWLVADGALGLFRPAEQRTSLQTYIVPEVQLQAQLPLGRVRPYLGSGIGLVAPVSGSSRKYGIFSGAAGARVSVTDALDVRGELRVTGVSATLAQWTLGLSHRL